ncbi:unnamed protein product [Clavelina lepadiformis]|uniref:Uncharacterized protein n=1 Tax=Clavelina lepadiformis TaxID=159417 RepID=A0ABP0GNF1_CLALP
MKVAKVVLVLALIEMTLAVICVILKGFGVATALENTHIYHGQGLEEFFSNVPTIPGLTAMTAGVLGLCIGCGKKATVCLINSHIICCIVAAAISIGAIYRDVLAAITLSTSTNVTPYHSTKLLLGVDICLIILQLNSFGLFLMSAYFVCHFIPGACCSCRQCCGEVEYQQLKTTDDSTI